MWLHRRAGRSLTRGASSGPTSPPAALAATQKEQADQENEERRQRPWIMNRSNKLGQADKIHRTFLSDARHARAANSSRNRPCAALAHHAGTRHGAGDHVAALRAGSGNGSTRSSRGSAWRAMTQLSLHNGAMGKRERHCVKAA